MTAKEQVMQVEGGSDGGGWKQVAGGRRGRKRTRKHRLSSSGATARDGGDDHSPLRVNVGPVRSRVERARASLPATAFFREVLAAVRAGLAAPGSDDAVDVVCFGLGSVTQAINSQHQLGLLLALVDALGTRPRTLLAFDPAFTAQDNELLAGLGVEVATVNTHCKHRATRRTLVFMPHCDKAHYQNLVGSNLAAAGQAARGREQGKRDGMDEGEGEGEATDTLHNVVLVGNSFASYVLRSAKGEQDPELRVLVAVGPRTKEHCLRETFPDRESALNDTSVHTFRPLGQMNAP